MNRHLGVLSLLAVVALAGAAATHERHHVHEPSYWQGFKNALSDMNPFASKLGHDWSDTQTKVENIYQDTHADAQRRVAELKEEALLKDQKELQKKIADIYLAAATEAEKRIEKMKRPLLASLFRHHEEEEHFEPGYMRGAFEKAKDMVGDAATAVKSKFSPQEETTMFEDTSKKISDAYRQAVEKAKSAASNVAPAAGEAWHETKQKAQKAYDDVFQRTHGEARGMLRTMSESLGRGVHRAADMASTAAWKTWHLLLHGVLAMFWMFIGAVGATGLVTWLNKRQFRKQLAAPVVGPVVLSKEFMVLGTEDYARKFQDYWTNAAGAYFNRQPGLRKYTLQRGVDIGSNQWHHLSEWNSIEDLRRALTNPEMKELKKRMPHGFLFKLLSKHAVTQLVTTGKGPAASEGDVGVVRPEGLRQRTQGGPSSTPIAT